MFQPDAFAPRLCGVKLDELAAGGIRGIIVDLDNTLVGYGHDEIAAEDRAWIVEALRRGFRICLLSNNFTARVARIGRLLDVPAVSSALKPLPRGFLTALAVLQTRKSETVVVGDQLFTDVFGAKLVGLHAILIEPLVARDWHGTRILRFFERAVLRRGRAR